MQYRNERTGDVITVPKELYKKYDALDHYKRVTAASKPARKTEEK